MTTTTPGKLVASPQALAALARLRGAATVAKPQKTAQPPALAKAAPETKPAATVDKPTPGSSPPPAKPAPAPEPAAQQKAAAATAAARQEANRARRAQANDLIEVLRARWPLAFSVPRPPLAIGIDKEIRAALGEAIDQAPLRLAIGSWVQRVDYLEAVVRGEPRRNLDGTPGDEPSEAARQNAAAQLRRIDERGKSGIEAWRERVAKAQAAQAARAAANKR